MIIPKGDLSVEVESNAFPIYCHLNPTYKYFTEYNLTSKDLVFINVKENHEAVEMESEILNETTIFAMYKPSAQMSDDLIKCNVILSTGDARAICNKHVYVGGKY